MLIFLFVLIFYLLSVLSSILIPLVLAFLFASFFQPLIMLLKRRRVPMWIILPVVAVITLAILFGISQLVIETINQLSEQQDYLLAQLSEKANALANWIDEILRSNFNYTFKPEKIDSVVDFEKISDIAGGVASSIGSFTTSFLMFAIYYVVLLPSISNYERFLKYVGGLEGNKLVSNYERIQKSIISYLGVKTVVSLMTGVFAYLICTFFGVKFAFFWGFLTFLFNFIPTIGSTIAVIFPVLMGIIQFDEIRVVFIMTILLTIIQMIMGNIVEPIMMGNRLRLNTLTVLFGLVFWGYLWGIAGMILSVPLLVILKLVLELNPDLSLFGRLMGTPGKEPKIKMKNLRKKNNSTEG